MSIGRPLQFDPEQVLDAAMQVFWASGYDATSLQDLLQAMRLSKSSFYQTFGSKQQLFERCLRRYREQTAQTLMARLDALGSGRRFIAELLESAVDEARSEHKPRGCLVMNTANEFAQRDPEVAAGVQKGVNRFKGIFETAVRRSQGQGEIPPERDPETLALYLVSSMSGIKTLVKAGLDDQSAERIVGVILSALD
jgi:TetR/AcrR family transcriptional repressor of nem operon